MLNLKSGQTSIIALWLLVRGYMSTVMVTTVGACSLDRETHGVKTLFISPL